MPRQNFHKKHFYHHGGRRKWIVSFLFFLVFIGFFVMRFSKPDKQPPPPVENRAEIQAKTPMPISEQMKRVDELCSSLPKPEEFYFAGKTNSTETDRFVSIIHRFKSSRSKDEIYPTFVLWFGANGWTDDKTPYDQIEFSKNKQTISIAPFSTKEGDYFGINCTEWKVE
jgi:hypothetical protein